MKLKYPVTALVAGDTDPDAHVDAGLIGLLLAAGSDPARTDKRGRTALSIARAQAQSDLAAVADGCPTVVGAGEAQFNGTGERQPQRQAAVLPWKRKKTIQCKGRVIP